MKQCIVGLAFVCSLAAAGSAGAQERLNYAGQTDASVNVEYFDLPASTQLFYLNQVDGAKWAALVPLISGTGSMAVPMPAGPGQFSVVAEQGGVWVAQTVMFYAKEPE